MRLGRSTLLFALWALGVLVSAARAEGPSEALREARRGRMPTELLDPWGFPLEAEEGEFVMPSELVDPFSDLALPPPRRDGRPTEVLDPWAPTAELGAALGTPTPGQPPRGMP